MKTQRSLTRQLNKDINTGNKNANTGTNTGTEPPKIEENIKRAEPKFDINSIKQELITELKQSLKQELELESKKNTYLSNKENRTNMIDLLPKNTIEKDAKTQEQVASDFIKERLGLPPDKNIILHN